MQYTGTIIEESLDDNRILNSLEILAIRISNSEQPEDRWHLYKVQVTKEDIDLLATHLKPEKWYMHFWHGDSILAVFPHKIFRFSHKDKSSWADAVAYGKSLGIPEAQLDFVIE